MSLEPSLTTPVYWWLSFCDPEAPKGEQFLGAICIQAPDFMGAVALTHFMGINPGGEVAGADFPEGVAPPTDWCGRLLSREDCAELDRVMLEQIN